MVSLNVSFLGLGAIGTPMAAHLSRVANLTVWNRTVAKAELFAAQHSARLASTPRAAATGADVFMTCFPTSADVDAVLFQPGGAADALEPGSIVVDCTSGDPAASRAIAERLGERGVDFIDAPVSGGVIGAEAGQLTVMCGGDPAVLERARGALEPFARKIVHCGAVGAGDAVKAVNNALLAVHIWSTAEGLAMLVKLGVEASVALQVINASSGRSNTSMNLFPERVITREFPRTFRLALLEKDAGIAAAIARETRTPAEIIELTAHLFHDARAELGDEADHVEAARVVERRAGTTIQ